LLGADPGLALPKLSLPVRLALLVAGTTLPLILFAAGIVFNQYKQDRKNATQRVFETVYSIRLVLDAEMQRITGALQVLSLTNALRDGDFKGFRRICQGFLDQYGEGGVVLVADREGRQVFSSLTPDTANLPLRNNLPMVAKVFAEKKPVYSNLFFGSVKKRLIVTVEVPVMQDDEVLYDISFSPPIEIFQAMIEQQRPSRDWTISIFDSEGTNFARVPNPQETVGKRASPSLTEMFQNPEVTMPTISLEGVPLITSFARSSLTGWTVAAGVAESSLAAPLWRNLAITSVMGAVLLMVGLAFAVRMATQIARGEMLHNLLIEELNHRVKNTLAVLQSITTQTFRSASRAERAKFEGRLGALAEAHNLLSQEKWQGAELREVIVRVLQPYLLNNTPERVRMFGPQVPLSPRLAVMLSMIVHEIATNAAKYGALSNDTGTVAVDWEILEDSDGRKLRLIWTEAGGPPVTTPVQRGFGSRLIERSARDQLGGEATVDFLPRGVVYTLTCALDREE
jgi:two-component sensor histidine kinase